MSRKSTMWAGSWLALIVVAGVIAVLATPDRSARPVFIIGSILVVFVLAIAVGVSQKT